MRLSGIACAVVGHRWAEAPDSREAYPLFECTRCGRREEFAPGTRHAGFDTRVGAESEAGKAVGPFGRRP